MSGEFFIAALTGFCWSLIGIVLSRSAKDGFDIVSYSLMQNLAAAVLCFFVYTRLSEIVWNGGFALLCGIILAAAGMNALAQYLVQRAMQSGHYAPVWSMAQAAMIFPFLCGIIFWKNPAEPVAITGLCCILCGVILPGYRNFRNFRSWFYCALGAFFCYGVLQSLYLIPSHVGSLADPGRVRPALACLGCFAGWGGVALFRRRPLKFTIPAMRLAGGMALIHLASVALFFASLDFFSQAGKGGSAMPFMLGVNLAVFGLYSFFFLRERRTVLQLIAEVLILGGLLFFCMA